MLRILKILAIALGGLLGLSILVFFALVFWPMPELPVAGEDNGPIAITNVTVIDPQTGAVHTNYGLEIQRGVIESMGPTDDLEYDHIVDRIDGTGRYLIPGLWDMHTHMGTGYAPYLTLPLFIAGGVTGIRDMGGFTSPALKTEWHQDAIAGKLAGPRLMGQAVKIVTSLPTDSAALALVDRTKPQDGFIKVYNHVRPGPFFTLLNAAKESGLTVAGHKPRGVNAIDAARAGQRSFEHARLFLFECYDGAEQLRQRYRNIYAGTDTIAGPVINTAVRRAMVDHHNPALFDSLTQAMVASDTWFCPTHITRKMDAFADNPEWRDDPRLKYIHFLQRMGWHSDADGMIERDPSPAGREAFMDFYLKGLELTGAAHRAGVRILAGTDANDTYCFPGLALHDELMELARAGLSPLEVLRTATTNPAEFYGLSDEYGGIAPGKRADLVLLDANPLEDVANFSKIEAVAFDGRIYRRAQLDALLRGVEDSASSLSLAAKLVWNALSR